MKKPFSWYLAKMDRIAAWALLMTMFLYFVSGYGMTKGLINSKLAINIHNNWLPLILLTSFSTHTCYAISLALRRWKIWNALTKVFLILFYIAFFIGFVYINSFYVKPNNSVQSPTNMQVSNVDSESSENDENTQSQLQNNSNANSTSNFTLAQVATHNGFSDCWIVLSNIVYDITSYQHSGPQSHIICGEDNTSALSSAHGLNYVNYFSSYKIGNLIK